MTGEQKQRRKVSLVCSEILTALSDGIPANVNRSSLVSLMISAYGLDEQCEILTPKPATRDQLTQFHDAGFVTELLRYRKSVLSDSRVEMLSGLGLSVEDAEEEDEEDRCEKDHHSTLERYGLLYDCPVFPLMEKYVRYLAGSTICAAHQLMRSDSLVVINWFGGRHHAKKSRASGFCYVNDIVLGILELRKKFDKVVYVDLDLHHGDGVENAFKFSDKVITMSVHRKEIGFFPGSGDLKDQGMGKGKGFTFNAPVNHGLSDDTLMNVVGKCILPVITRFEPDCLVIQCGADGLGADEHQEWNLTIKGLGKAVNTLLKLNKPTLITGGGGYNHGQVARCWTYITSMALQFEEKQFDLLPDSLVTDDEVEYEFWNDKGHNMLDSNSQDYISDLSADFLSRSWM